MRILSIGKTIQHDTLHIVSIGESQLNKQSNLDKYRYIIISGGDGAIRRVVTKLQHITHSATFILNPTGSFNVIAKLHKVPQIKDVLALLAKGETPKTQTQTYANLNNEVFLFSAGNMGDLQHIFLAETLRFGILKNGMAKYLIALLFLLPVHLIMTPFMLLSSKRFFIFTPVSFIKKFGSFYGKVQEMKIDLENNYNHVELDGDIVTIEESLLHIKPAGSIKIVVR